MSLLLYFIFCCIFTANCLHLTKDQMNSVVSLIKTNKLNPMQRTKINKILFISYEKWAIKKAIEFKSLHHYKCRNIDKHDLIISSKIGLFRSIGKYNGNTSFLYFSEIYIKGELFSTLTNHFSFSSISKKDRMKKKSNLTKIELYRYKKLLEPSWVGYSDYWRFDKYNKNTETMLDRMYIKESSERMWNEINKLDPTLNKILYLKYDCDFNKIRSNKEIGELLAYSEEYVRLKINKCKLIIKKMVSI